MNYYLIEPYNAYQKPAKKRHWMQDAEDEALFFRLVEAQKQAEAQKTSQNNQNVALPQHQPQPASQQVQDGQFAAAAGGGGYAHNFDLELQEVASFTISPSSGIGPLSVAFTNTTRTPGDDTFLWDFGTGSLTSTDASPADLIYVQTGSFTITLQETSSEGAMSIASNTLTVTAPTLNGAIILSATSAVAPYSASFTGSHTYNGSGTITGSWIFGDGTANKPYTASVGFYHVYNTGSFTASLSLTESSYRITDTDLVYFSGSIPTVVASFTYTTSSNIAPMTGTFDNTSIITSVDGPKNYTWAFGDSTSSLLVEPGTHIYTNSGSFTASLTLSGSYNLASRYAVSFSALGPTLTAGFTFTTSSATAPSVATFVNTLNGAGGTQYNGNGSLTYYWTLGSGSLTATTSIPNPTTYTVAGGYTASLYVTESSFGLTSTYQRSWSLA